MTEYHQPLANLQLHEIFELSQPLLPLTQEFIPESLRISVQKYRPARLRPPKHKRGDYIVDIETKEHYSSLLSERDRREIVLTTGDYAPAQGPEDFRPSQRQSRLAALRSLSIGPRFAKSLLVRREVLPPSFIGVHFRNTDRHSDMGEVVSNVKSAYNSTGLTDVVWCTDDFTSIEEAKILLPGFRLSTWQRFRSDGLLNLHYGLRGAESEQNLGLALADLYSLVVADVFIPSQGGWASLVPLLRDETDLAKAFFNLTT